LLGGKEGHFVSLFLPMEIKTNMFYYSIEELIALLIKNKYMSTMTKKKEI
jgi:hypothetical protein